MDIASVLIFFLATALTRGYNGLHEVTRGYRGLQKVTRGYRGLQGVTRG